MGVVVVEGARWFAAAGAVDNYNWEIVAVKVVHNKIQVEHGFVEMWKIGVDTDMEAHKHIGMENMDIAAALLLPVVGKIAAFAIGYVVDGMHSSSHLHSFRAFFFFAAQCENHLFWFFVKMKIFGK